MTGFRTLLFSALVAILGVFEAFDWGLVIPEKYVGIALIVIGAIIAYLRKITTTPIGKKVEPVATNLKAKAKK